MVPPVLRGEATWSELRKYGIGWWVRSNDTLRRLIEKVKNKKTMYRKCPQQPPWGQKKSGGRREVAVVERFKQESMY